MTRPPVILFGMHRSGTTMVVQLLQRLGFFAGAHLDDNAEAWFFLRLNEWLLRRAGGAWDRPLAVKALLRDVDLRAAATAIFAEAVRSKAFARFVPDRRTLTSPWGWKDPRSVFTFDLWRQVFPGARLLNVRRHGVDVAGSLVARHRRLRADGETVLRRWSLASRMKAALQPFEFLNHFSLSARCTTLDGAFDLWEEYVGEAEAVFSAFDGDKLAVDFEELVHASRAKLREIAVFCGCSVDEARLIAAAETIDARRARAFARDPELVAFHARVRSRPLMRALGYDARAEVES